MAMGTLEVWREILEDIIEDLCFYFWMKDVTNTLLWTEKTVMYMSKRIKERGNDEEKESA